MPTLNGSKTIGRALRSIFEQTIPPSRVCVVDGGSTDMTWTILREYARTHRNLCIRRNNLPDKRAITIVHHYNMALDLLGTSYDYWFFHADDCVFPTDYVERLLERMVTESVDVASGDWGLPNPLDKQKAPQGAGRLVSRSVMAAVGFHFPIRYGYESWLLGKAEQLGFKLRCYTNIRFELLTKFGIEAWHPKPEDGVGEGHNFYEWGYAMRVLGYAPFYVLLRMISDLIWNQAIPKRAAFQMAWDYASTYWNPKVKSDPYSAPLDDQPYLDYVSRNQINRIGRNLMVPAHLLIKTITRGVRPNSISSFPNTATLSVPALKTATHIFPRKKWSRENNPQRQSDSPDRHQPETCSRIFSPAH